MSQLVTEIQRTPLYRRHCGLNARMVSFAGWAMPVQYQSILEEHRHTRTGVSIFDTCHMSEFRIRGNLARSGLDRIITCRMVDIPIGVCRYGLMLDRNGHVLDDLIVFREGDEEWFIVANGGTIEKDVANFTRHLTTEAEFTNLTRETGKIDVQGPRSRAVLASLIPGVEKLGYFTFRRYDVLGHSCLVSRTGYTGELGYELYINSAVVGELWDRLLENEAVRPAGLGARDLLRLEMGYSLYGQDITESISPLEAGLSRFVDFEKDFIGKPALQAQKENGVPRRAVCLMSESRRSPRHGQTIYAPDGSPIGEVTSGAYSPCLEKGIGLGLVDKAADLGGRRVLFGDEHSRTAATLTKRPFYTKGSLKA